MKRRGRPQSEKTDTISLRVPKKVKDRLKLKYGKGLNHVFVEKLKQLDLDEE